MRNFPAPCEVTGYCEDCDCRLIWNEIMGLDVHESSARPFCDDELEEMALMEAENRALYK